MSDMSGEDAVNVREVKAAGFFGGEKMLRCHKYRAWRAEGNIHFAN
jgi:hypothetical protein